MASVSTLVRNGVAVNVAPSNARLLIVVLVPTVKPWLPIPFWLPSEFPAMRCRVTGELASQPFAVRPMLLSTSISSTRLEFPIIRTPLLSMVPSSVSVRLKRSAMLSSALPRKISVPAVPGLRVTLFAPTLLLLIVPPSRAILSAARVMAPLLAVMLELLSRRASAPVVVIDIVPVPPAEMPWLSTVMLPSLLLKEMLPLSVVTR